MPHREGELLIGRIAIRQVAMVFFPSRFIGEPIEVLLAGMMMLAHRNPAQAGEKALRLLVRARPLKS